MSPTQPKPRGCWEWPMPSTVRHHIPRSIYLKMTGFVRVWAVSIRALLRFWHCLSRARAQASPSGGGPMWRWLKGAWPQWARTLVPAGKRGGIPRAEDMGQERLAVIGGIVGLYASAFVLPLDHPALVSAARRAGTGNSGSNEGTALAGSCITPWRVPLEATSRACGPTRPRRAAPTSRFRRRRRPAPAHAPRG